MKNLLLYLVFCAILVLMVWNIIDIQKVQFDIIELRKEQEHQLQRIEDGAAILIGHDFEITDIYNILNKP